MFSYVCDFARISPSANRLVKHIKFVKRQLNELQILTYLNVKRYYPKGSPALIDIWHRKHLHCNKYSPLTFHCLLPLSPNACRPPFSKAQWPHNQPLSGCTGWETARHHTSQTTQHCNSKYLLSNMDL